MFDFGLMTLEFCLMLLIMFIVCVVLLTVTNLFASYFYDKKISFKKIKNKIGG